MTRAIAKLTVAIALVAVLSCKAANAPLVDAPLVVTLSEAGASENDGGSADFHTGGDAPIFDAGPPVEIVEVEDAAAFGPVGDQAHHEKITLSLRGYQMVLASAAIVTVTSPGGKTHVALNQLPARESYFLDNAYVDRWGMRAGDVMYCVPLQSRTIDLIEYVDEGQRWSIFSGHQSEKQRRVSSYRTTDLRGVIDIEIDYFSDSKCRVPKALKKRITR